MRDWIKSATEPVAWVTREALFIISKWTCYYCNCYFVIARYMLYYYNIFIIIFLKKIKKKCNINAINCQILIVRYYRAVNRKVAFFEEDISDEASFRRRFRLIWTWFRARNRGQNWSGRPNRWWCPVAKAKGSNGDETSPGHDSIPSQSERIWITGGVGRDPRTQFRERMYARTHAFVRDSRARFIHGTLEFGFP